MLPLRLPHHRHREIRAEHLCVGAGVLDRDGKIAAARGEIENPLSGKREVDLPTARFLIDVIAMLQDKTKGNRTPDEDAYLSGVLANLRMAFVAKTGTVAQAGASAPPGS